MADAPSSSKADAATGSPADPLTAGVDRIRDVAKWLIGAFAAVAAIMVAGSQLSSIGTLEVGWRLLVAVIGGVAALSGAAWAIWLLTDVLLPEETTVANVLAEATDCKSPLARTIAANPHLLLGYPDVAALDTAYKNARAEQARAQDLVNASPNDQAALQQVDQAAGKAERLFARLRQLTTRAAFYRQQQEFKDSRTQLYLAALLAAIGLGTFAWAANPPEDKKEDTAAPAPAVAAPATVQIILNAEGKQTLTPLLGDACASQATGTGVKALAIAATATTVDLVIIPGGLCERPARFTLTLAQGIAIPLSTVTPPTPSPSPR